METVYVMNSNSQVNVHLEFNYTSKLKALEEAVKVLRREIIRYEADPHYNSSR